jgi:hypothetical protein
VNIKQGSIFKVPIRLAATADGTPVTGALYTQVVVYIQKQGGASALKLVSASDWVEIDGANMPGVYDLTLSAGDTDTVGFFKYSVTKSAALTYVGLVQIDAATVSDIATSVNSIYGWTSHIPANPAQESTVSAQSADITSILTAVNLIKPNTDKFGSITIPSSKADVTAVSTDTSNVLAIVSRIENDTTRIPAGPVAVSDLNAAMQRIEGAGFNPAYDSLYGISQAFQAGGTADSTFIAAIKAKTDNLPTSPADNTLLTSVSTALTAAQNGISANAVSLGGVRGVVDAIIERTSRIPDQLADARTHGDWMTGIHNHLNSQDQTLGHISGYTDRIPGDVATLGRLNALFVEIEGVGFGVGDTLHDIGAGQRVGGGADSQAINAIKLKTDNLPASPANQATINNSFSSLSGQVTGVSGQVAAIPTNPALAPTLAAAMGSGFDTSTDSLQAISAHVTDTNISVPAAIAAIKAQTDNLPAQPADQAWLEGFYLTKFSKLVTDELAHFGTLDSKFASIKAQTDLIPPIPLSKPDFETYTDTNTTLITDAVSASHDDLKIDIGKAQTSLDDIKGAGWLVGSDDLHSISLSVTSGGTPAGLLNDVAAIRERALRLPDDPASQSSVLSATTALYTLTSSINSKIGVPTNTIASDLVFQSDKVTAIQQKVAALPSDPASNTQINAVVQALGGVSYVPTLDNLHAIHTAMSNISGGGGGGGLTPDQDAALSAIKYNVELIQPKTANLPADPASQNSISTTLNALTTEVQSATGFALGADNKAGQILTKMSMFPQEPLSRQLFENFTSQVMGTGYQASTDNFHYIASMLNTVESQLVALNVSVSSSNLLPAIKAKTDLIPDFPATATSITALSTALATDVTNIRDDISHIGSGAGAVQDSQNISAILAKVTALPTDPADQSLVETAITAAVTTVRADIATTKLAIDSKPAPNNSGIAAIMAKTDNLPFAPADQPTLLAVQTALNAIKGTGFDTTKDSLHVLATQTGGTGMSLPDSILAIKAKTDLLPAAPADQARLDTLIASELTHYNSLNTNVSSLGSRLNGLLLKTDFDTGKGEIVTAITGVKTDVATVRTDLGTTRTDIKSYLGGAGFVPSLDTLHAIRTSISLLQTGGLTTSQEQMLMAVKGKTDMLPSDPATTADITTSEAAILASIRAIPTSGFSGADRTNLVNIWLKAQNLPVDPAKESTVISKIAAIPADFTSSDRIVLQDVQRNVQRLPADPASQAAVLTAISAIPPGFTALDRSAVTAIKTKTDFISGPTLLKADLNQLSTQVGLGFTDIKNTMAAAGPSGLTDAQAAMLAAVQDKTDFISGPTLLRSDLTPIKTKTDLITSGPFGLTPAQALMLAAIKTKTDFLPDRPADAATIEAVRSEVDLIKTMVGKALVLLYYNSVMDEQVYDDNGVLLSARIRGYDSATNANTAGATGLLYTLRVVVVYDTINPTIPVSLRIIDG